MDLACGSLPVLKSLNVPGKSNILGKDHTLTKHSYGCCLSEMQLLDKVVHNILLVSIFAQYVGDQSSVLHRPEDTKIPISFLPM